MRQPLKNLCTSLEVFVLLLVVALILILILAVLLILGVLTVLALVIRVVILVLIVLFIIVRHICDLLIGHIFFSYRSSMSISHKNMPKNMVL